MAQFVEYDPLRGVAQYEDRTQGGNLQLHYRQDVEPILEVAKYERDNGIADRMGKENKQDIYLYARIPPVVILKLKYEHGLDLFNRNHLKRVMEVINSDYPYLKCTDKVHRIAQ
jgi:hypothetical protein